MKTDKEKIQEALDIAFQYSQIDGAHHKAWAIDQMVRALCGDDYEKWVYNYEHDENTDEREWFWDVGIAP